MRSPRSTGKRIGRPRASGRSRRRARGPGSWRPTRRVGDSRLGRGLVFAELGATKKAIEQRLQACWRYAVKAAKVPHYRFHDLRHTYGTLLRREGKTFSDIAAIMGITEAMAHVYAHEDTERIQRETAKLGTNPPLSRLARFA